MQCGDLERYLEAFLDGRLGRSRSGILRRHLTSCGGCRARIERLRQFERDMQRRFRSMDQDRSIWQGLELDLVASGRSASGPILALPRLLPAPRQDGAADPPTPATAAPRARYPFLAARPDRGSRRSRLAGLALVAMAVGALYQLGHRHLVPVGDPEAAAQAYGRLLDAESALALQSGDPARLETWLADELGTPVDLPATPDGFRLMGVDRAELPSGPTGAVIYRSAAGEANGTVLLLVQAAGDHGQAAKTEPEAFTEASVPNGSGAGLHELSWSLDSNRFTLVSALAPDELRRFVGGGERAQ